MKTQLSNSGPTISRIVAGVWKWGQWSANLTTKEESNLIQACIEAGISTFDHADIYGDYEEERRFGESFKAIGIAREDIQIVTKCGIKLISANRPDHRIKCYDTTSKHIHLSVENSLRTLQTEYIDLLLIHRPSPLMDFQEIGDTFHQLKASGKVKHFGVSNFNTKQYQSLNAFFPLVTNQVEASLIHLDPFLDGTFDMHQELKTKPMIWSPLGSGKLFGNQGDPQVERINNVAQTLCEKYNCTFSQIYLAFLLKHPANLIPVLGTSKIPRILEAKAALEISIDNDEWFELWIAAMGEDVP